MQAFPMPGPVRNAATFTWPAGYHLAFPFWHLVFTPFCSVADALTVLSLKEQILMQVWDGHPLDCAVRAGSAALLAWLAWLLFIAWGALVPHPMACLMTDNPRTLLIDFHSHSQYLARRPSVVYAGSQHALAPEPGL